MYRKYFQSEIYRLRFIEQRDGKAGAVAFAKQTYGIYRAARRQKRGYGYEYRIPLVCSLLVLRKYLRTSVL